MDCVLEDFWGIYREEEIIQNNLVGQCEIFDIYGEVRMISGKYMYNVKEQMQAMRKYIRGIINDRAFLFCVVSTFCKALNSIDEYKQLNEELSSVVLSQISLNFIDECTKLLKNGYDFKNYSDIMFVSYGRC